MSITVLLPVYNGEATLPSAIGSILRQELADFELLIIDDASTDASAAIAREYAREDARIRLVVHASNMGLAATLNEGLRLARHELVARMDQDDEALPARLGVQSAFLAERPSVVAAGSWVLHMGASSTFDRLVRVPTEHSEIVATLERENCFYHPTMMLRRSSVLEVGGYRPEFRNAEDYDLWLRLSRDHELANVPEPLLRYRFSAGGMTLSRKWEQLYYVYLAQAAAADAAHSFEASEQRAREALARTDRGWFLAQVAKGTVQELLALHQWRDAAVVAARFAREIGPRGMAGVLSDAYKAATTSKAST